MIFLLIHAYFGVLERIYMYSTYANIYPAKFPLWYQGLRLALLNSDVPENDKESYVFTEGW